MSHDSTALTILSTTIRQDADGRYCLNDCHKASGAENAKRPSLWAENFQTKSLIAELEGSAGNPAHVFRVVTGGPNEGRGTYVCKELVYAYAMWISPAFNLKVIRAFDALVSSPPAPKPKRVRKTPFDTAFRRCMNVAALLPNFDDNQRLMMAARGTYELTGVNPLELLGATSLPAPVQEVFLTPTEIGKRIGLSGQKTNEQLRVEGYQVKDPGSATGCAYKPTEKGTPFARFFDTTRRGGKGSQQQLKWSEKIADLLGR